MMTRDDALPRVDSSRLYLRPVPRPTRSRASTRPDSYLSVFPSVATSASCTVVVVECRRHRVHERTNERTCYTTTSRYYYY